MADVTALPTYDRERSPTTLRSEGVRLPERWEDAVARLRAMVDQRPVASVIATVALGYLVSRFARRWRVV